jgi:hypothetical protein
MNGRMQYSPPTLTTVYTYSPARRRQEGSGMFQVGDRVTHDGTTGEVLAVVVLDEDGTTELYVNVGGSPGYFPAEETVPAGVPEP